MPETLRAYMVSGDTEPRAHLVRGDAAKTLCRAFESIPKLYEHVDEVCPACLEVLRTDWLLEYETTRKCEPARRPPMTRLGRDLVLRLSPLAAAPVEAASL